MRPTFGNSINSMREVIITSILSEFDQKNNFLEGCSWFKLNYLGPPLGISLKFYTSELKIKTKKFWGRILGATFVEVTEKKPIGVGLFGLPPS